MLFKVGYVGVNKMQSHITFSDRWWHQKVNTAIKNYYLNDLKKSEKDWQEHVSCNVKAFNLVWRAALKTVVPSVELNGNPPPEHLRKIYLFRTSAGNTESATN